MQVFSPDCTLPSDGVTFVGAPHIRGTLSIVWSCALVLLACTWSILHPNVPPQSTIEPGNWTQKLRRTAARTWTKIKWMMSTLLAPEYALGKAFSDFFSVRYVKPRFDAFSGSDSVPWTAAHTHFANMGGFAIKFASLDGASGFQQGHRRNDWSMINLKKSVSAPAYLDQGRYLSDVVEDCTAQTQLSNAEMAWSPGEHIRVLIEHTWKTFDKDLWKLGYPSHETFEEFAARRSWAIGKTDWLVDSTNTAIVDSALRTIDMSYFRNESEASIFLHITGSWARNISLLRSNLWILDANQLLMARELGIIEKLPFLASDDLDDRNKQDLILKLLALGQISWFVLEMCLRLHRRLSVSLLEVMVLAFSLCTVFIYLLLLNKPNNAAYSITIPAARHPRTAHEMVRLALVGPAPSGWVRRSPWIPNNAMHLEHRLIEPSSTSFGQYVGYGRYTTYGSAACALVFGAAHCIAWNFQFPTDIEKTMWHVSSVITMAVYPIAFLLSVSLGSVSAIKQRLLYHAADGGFESLDAWVYYVTFLLFIAARLFILVEVLRSLAFLPPNVFIATWTSEVPHA